MWNRRSVLATFAGLSTGGAFVSTGSTAAQSTEAEATISSASGFSEGWSSAGGGPGNARYLPLEGEFPELDTETWRYDGDGSDEVELVAAVGDAVYVLMNGGGVHSLSADAGTVEWETATGPTGRPTVFEGAVYIAETDRVTALDLEDGDVLWEREIDGGDRGLTNPTAAYGADLRRCGRHALRA